MTCNDACKRVEAGSVMFLPRWRCMPSTPTAEKVPLFLYQVQHEPDLADGKLPAGSESCFFGESVRCPVRRSFYAERPAGCGSETFFSRMWSGNTGKRGMVMMPAFIPLLHSDAEDLKDLALPGNFLDLEASSRPRRNRFRISWFILTAIHRRISI